MDHGERFRREHTAEPRDRAEERRRWHVRARDEVRALVGDRAAARRRNEDVERRRRREDARAGRPHERPSADDRIEHYPGSTLGTAGLMAEDLPAVYAGRGPRGYRRSDARVREEVCERLTCDPWVDATEIDVEVREGQVVLRGTVEDREQKYRAEELVEAVSGVTDVVVELRVARRPDAEQVTRVLPRGAAARIDI